MKVIIDNDTVNTIESQGNKAIVLISERGPPGAKGDPGSPGIGSDANYVHIQNLTSTSWNVVHNLGKFPCIAVVDSAGTLVIGSVVYNSVNDLTVSFSQGFSGKVFCN